MDLITEAEELGKLFFTEDEIEIILSGEVKDVKTAIKKGQLISDAELRKTVVQQAKSGSGEAQKMVESWKSTIRFYQKLKR